MPTELEPVVQPTGLSFGRTVERALVHRTAVSEVFVTDVQQLGESTVRSGAQLPLNHGYFSDHLARPALFDPLLLLEAGRQAGIAGSHAHMGLRPGTAMIVDNFTLALDEPAALLIGRVPAELRIDTEYSGKRSRTGRVRRGRVEQQFFIDDTRVGEHAMDVLFVNQHEHEILRHSQRGTPAPYTSDYPDLAPQGQVAAEAVGRANPLNVVLARPRVAGGVLHALVTPRFGNRSLFDHDYDHLPAAVLVEAARQLALLAFGESTGPAAVRETQVVRLDASFGRFAELDTPVTASVRLPCGGPPSGTGRRDFAVGFSQAEEPIASVTITLLDSARLVQGPGGEPMSLPDTQ
ncbi:AfsA-related hotdog domain-containing protein [Kitasatospora sp. GP82]|uniref:AfsA-related hotdog domain-containing protein n=1 Tax=Kitasatospora sp. GP82 TaxID=3035089 RepID=UPI0024771DF3|nr:AfsA-related hotdog domain-containing protein [Kitasatospora sp. GP82]MDH6125245.1 hypothetical protein [Kitasatospora sp. GP82]